MQTISKIQINDANDNVLVSITSDGRMVFTNSNVSMSFSGTSQAMLDKIGLFREYTAVTSNNNFQSNALEISKIFTVLSI